MQRRTSTFSGMAETAPKNRNQIQEIFEMEQKPKESFDRNEPVIMVSLLLPYTLERNQKTGVLSIQKSFVKNPVMMYASLLDLCEKKQYNFHWVGLVITLEDVSEFEKV